MNGRDIIATTERPSTMASRFPTALYIHQEKRQNGREKTTAIECSQENGRDGVGSTKWPRQLPRHNDRQPSNLDCQRLFPPKVATEWPRKNERGRWPQENNRDIIAATERPSSMTSQIPMVKFTRQKQRQSGRKKMIATEWVRQNGRDIIDRDRTAVNHRISIFNGSFHPPHSR